MGYRTLQEKIAAYMSDRKGEGISSRQMAEAFMNELYISEYRGKKGGVTQLSSEIYKEVGNMQKKGKYPEVIYVPKSKKPKLYCWNEQFSYPRNIDDVPVRDRNFPETRPTATTRKQQKTKRKGKDEEGLYQPLVDYLRDEMKMYAERIDDKTSKKPGKGRNKWRHPDVVAVQGLISPKNLHHSIQQIAKLTSDRAKLWAFEVKEEITGRSLREDFHQTVSSSVWANYGYLCAERIDKDDDTEKELRQLNKAYGIGFILINRKRPQETHTVIEATERRVDLDICNALAKNNRDFEMFIEKAARVFELGIVDFY